MKSFKSILNVPNESIKEARVLNLIRNASYASKAKLEKTLSKFRNLENEIESLLDIAPSSTVDLNFSLKNINVEQFMNDLYSKVQDLYEYYQLVKIGTNLHNSMFPDDKVEGLSDYDKEFINNILSNETSTIKQEHSGSLNQ